MSATDPKEIKVRFAVDKSSFDQVKRQIQDLTTEVTKLYQSLDKVGGGLGGKPGFVSTTTQPTSSGSSGGAAGMTGLSNLSGAVTSRVSVGGNDITKVLGDNVRFLKSLSSGSKEVMKDMADSVKDSVTKQVQDLEKLRGGLRQYTSELKSIRTEIKQGGFFGAAAANRLPQKEGEAAQSLQEVIAAETTLNKSKAAGYAAGFTRSQMGIKRKAGEWLNTPLGQLASEELGYGQAGMITGAVSAGAIGVGVGMAAWQVAGESVKDTVMANLAYQAYEKSELVMQNRGAVGGLFGNLYNAARTGDLAYLDAFRKVGKSKEGINERQSGLARMAVLQAKNGLLPDIMKTGSESASLLGYLTGSAGGILDKIGQYNPLLLGVNTAYSSWKDLSAGSDITLSGMATTTAANFWKRVTGANKSTQEIAVAQGAAVIPGQIAINTQNMISQLQASDPVFQGLLRESSFGPAMGRISTSRGLMVSDAPRLDKFFGTPTQTAAEAAANDRRFASWDIGARIGATQQGLQYFGVRHAGMGQSYLGTQAGGFSNAMEVAGMSRQYGGNAFYNATQNSMGGAGGVDITVGAQIAQMVMGSMRGTNFGGNGAAAQAALAAAAYTGNSGTEMLRLRQMQQGMGVLGAEMGGKTDPLQNALNVMAGVRAVGDLSVYAQQDIRKLDPITMMGYLHDPSMIPKYLKDEGIDAAHLSKYAEAQRKYSYVRGAPGAEGSNYKALRETLFDKFGGDQNAYILGQINKAKGEKDQTAAKDAAIDQLAVLQMHDRDIGFTEARGYVTDMAAMTPGINPKLHGSRSTDPHSKKAVGEDIAESQAETNKTVDIARAKIAEDAKHLAATASASITELMKVDMKAVADSETKLAGVLDRLADFIERRFHLPPMTSTPPQSR